MGGKLLSMHAHLLPSRGWHAGCSGGLPRAFAVCAGRSLGSVPPGHTGYCQSLTASPSLACSAQIPFPPSLLLDRPPCSPARLSLEGAQAGPWTSDQGVGEHRPQPKNEDKAPQKM